MDAEEDVRRLMQIKGGCWLISGHTLGSLSTALPSAIIILSLSAAVVDSRLLNDTGQQKQRKRDIYRQLERRSWNAGPNGKVQETRAPLINTSLLIASPLLLLSDHQSTHSITGLRLN